MCVVALLLALGPAVAAAQPSQPEQPEQPADSTPRAAEPPRERPAPAAPARTGPALAVHGFVSTTGFAQNQAFGFGNGQNAEWALPRGSSSDRWFLGGDVRNTRISLTATDSTIAEGWSAAAVAELDFFGGFNGTGAFSAEQPQPRLRVAYLDLTRGRTTLRVGQAPTPLMGAIPTSLSHVGFPLGLGSAGVVGSRICHLRSPGQRTFGPVHRPARELPGD